MWFQSVGNNQWNDAVDYVYRHYTKFLDQQLTEYHDQTKELEDALIPFQALVVNHWYYAPSFLLIDNEEILLERWKERTPAEQKTFDRQRAGRIMLQFLGMYCDHHMDRDHPGDLEQTSQDHTNCDLIGILRTNGVIPGGAYPDSPVPDETHTVNRLQPRPHDLWVRIKNLLWNEE